MRIEKLFFLSFFFGCYTLPKSSAPPQFAWPIKKSGNVYSGIYNNSVVKNGYVVLKNGDTIRGCIKVIPFKDSPPGYDYFIPVLPTGKTKKNEICSINIKDINYVRVFANPSKNNGYFSDLVNVNDKELLQLLGKKGNAALYQNAGIAMDSLYDYEVLGNSPIFLFSKNKRVKLFSQLSCNWHHGHINLLMLKFINSRYKTSFQKNDFKTINDMINYILNKENEKESFKNL